MRFKKYFGLSGHILSLSSQAKFWTVDVDNDEDDNDRDDDDYDVIVFLFLIGTTILIILSSFYGRGFS